MTDRKERREPKKRLIVTALAVPAGGLTFLWLVRLVDGGAALFIGVLLIASAAILWGGLSRLHKRLSLYQKQAPTEAGTTAAGPAEILLDVIPDILFLIDDSRRVVAFNRAAKEEFPDTGLATDFSFVIRHPAVLRAVDRVLAEGREEQLEFSAGGGRQHHYRMHAVALFPPSSGDRLGGVALSIHDISAIRDAEKMRADFVANVSHELKTPLATVIGFIETLGGAAADDRESQKRFLGIMGKEAARMSRLIDDLLSLSQIERNEHRPPVDRINLKTLLEEAASLLDDMASQSANRIVLQCDIEDPRIAGDHDQLIQVFTNILTNALKYGRPDTEVTIGIHPPHRLAGSGLDGYGVTVSDHGPGIAASHLPRLTERFYRIDAARSRDVGGTGLGLAIVKHIVNRHRGDLRIDSTEGVGTRVTVGLPLFDRARDPAPDADR